MCRELLLSAGSFFCLSGVLLSAGSFFCLSGVLLSVGSFFCLAVGSSSVCMPGASSVCREFFCLKVMNPGPGQFHRMVWTCFSQGDCKSSKDGDANLTGARRHRALRHCDWPIKSNGRLEPCVSPEQPSILLDAKMDSKYEITNSHTKN